MEVHSDCVVSTTIYKVYCRCRVPSLFRYADQGDWDKIPARVQRHPSEAKFVHKYAPCDSALHRLVRPLDGVPFPTEDASSSLVPSSSNHMIVPSFADLIKKWLLAAARAILIANPAAASTPNLFGRTPLHLCCMGVATPARLAVALELAEHTPMVARLTDCQGKTPLHVLLQNNPWIVSSSSSSCDCQSDDARDLVQALVRADPKAWERHDSQGKTPLDLVIQHHDGSFALARWAQPLVPETIRVKTVGA